MCIRDSTVTSHIIVTFVLASFIFIGVTIIGFMKHGFGYLKLFVPSGVPAVLLPLIVVIEIISYLSRPISLSVRLFANMMAGHTMMKVFGGFVISLGIVGGWLPLSFSVALTGLEILVAFLQAYVFAILTCIYLNDALNLHPVSYTHLRAHETDSYLVCRLLLEKNFFNDTATTEIYT